MTISVPTALELTLTSVTDSTDYFDNTLLQSYPYGTKYQYNNSIYINGGDDIQISPYDSEATYIVDQVVFKDDLVQKCIATEGTFPLQPEAYSTGFDNTYDYTTWTKRYNKIIGMPVSASDEAKISSYGTSYGLNDIAISDDGTKLYQLNKTDGYIYMFTLNVNSDISGGITYVDSLMVSVTGDIEYFFFGNNGSKLYCVDAYNTRKIYQYSLTTAWDIGGGASLDTSKDLYGYTTGVTRFNHNGTKLIELDIGDEHLYEFNVSTPWDLSTLSASPSGSFLISNEPYTTDSLVNFNINSTGTKLFVKTFNGFIYEYSLGTTGSILGTNTMNGYIKSYIGSTGLLITNDGNRLIETLGFSNEIHQSTLITNGSIVDGVIYSLNHFRIWTDYHPSYYLLYDFYLDTKRFELSAYDKADMSLDIDKATSSIDYVYSYLNNSTPETKAFIFNNVYGTSLTHWFPETIILNSTGLYIRTTVSSSIEYETVTSYQFSIITKPSDIPNFVYYEPTNWYKPFDDKNYSVATASSPVLYTITGTESFDTVSLGKVKADHVLIYFKDPLGNIVTTIDTDIDCSIDDAGIISPAHTTIIYYSSEIMEAGSTVEITLTSTNTIELGTIKLGQSINAGFTNLAIRHRYKDFSTAEYDAWGNIDYIERQRISSYSGSVDIHITNYDKTIRLFEYLGKKLVIVNGSTTKDNSAPDSQNIFSSTQKIGRFMSFEQKTNVKDNDMDVYATYTFTLDELA